MSNQSRYIVNVFEYTTEYSDVVCAKVGKRGGIQITNDCASPTIDDIRRRVCTAVGEQVGEYKATSAEFNNG